MSFSHHRVPHQLLIGVDIAAATATAVGQSSEKKLSKAIMVEQTPEGDYAPRYNWPHSLRRATIPS